MLVGEQNIGILHHKKAKLPKHLQQSVYKSICSFNSFQKQVKVVDTPNFFN